MQGEGIAGENGGPPSLVADAARGFGKPGSQIDDGINRTRLMGYFQAFILEKNCTHAISRNIQNAVAKTTKAKSLGAHSLVFVAELCENPGVFRAQFDFL